MAKDRTTIQNRINKKGNNIDTLFSNNYIDDSTEIEEPLLSTATDIREYYDNHTGGKQVSIYLPEEIHSLIKSKASKESTSMKDAIKKVLIYQYLTDEEIKEAYKNK